MMDRCHGGRKRPDPNCVSSSSYKRITRAVTDGDRNAVARQSVRIGFDLAFKRGLLRSPPPETIFLHRKLVGSFLLLARIGARVDARSLVLQVLATRS
jgi:hypothetical protein